MRMHHNFKNPNKNDLDDDDDELVNDIPAVDAVESDVSSDAFDDEHISDDEISYDDSDFNPNDFENSDESLQELSDRNNADEPGPSGSRAVNTAPSESDKNALELNEDEEDDETVRAIIAAIKKQRTSPPEIHLDDFISDICFHPEHNIIALAMLTGDIGLYEYNNDENKLLRTIEVHTKACRDVDFTEDGLNLISCSADKSIMITDMETEKLKKFYDKAHNDAINKLHIIDEHLFATGDDSGIIKLWDLRTKNEIFALKEVEDYITQMLTNDDKKLLLATSGDGLLTTINIAARKLYVQSEPYNKELTCMGLYRSDSKLVVGSLDGILYAFNWGQFGYHCDMYPGLKTSINQMIPITDRIACLAGEEGNIYACHIAPFRNLGVVGQHQMGIECLDVNSTGELIASSSQDGEVRFWNVKYFEEFGDIKYNEKHNTFKEKRNNLPSSKFSNASDFFADLAAEASTDDEP